LPAHIHRDTQRIEPRPQVRQFWARQTHAALSRSRVPCALSGQEVSLRWVLSSRRDAGHFGYSVDEAVSPDYFSIGESRRSRSNFDFFRFGSYRIGRNAECYGDITPVSPTSPSSVSFSSIASLVRSGEIPLFSPIARARRAKGGCVIKSSVTL